MTDRLAQWELLIKTASRKPVPQLFGAISRKARNEILPRIPVDFDAGYRREIPANLITEYSIPGADTDRLRGALSDSERQRFRTLAMDFNDDRVSFLNRTRTLSDPATVVPSDDRIAGLPRLWYLKLVAFEPLRWAVLGFNDSVGCDELVTRIESWLRRSSRDERIASRVGYLRGFWTPYSTSRRIIALCRYSAWAGGLDAEIEQFLFKNLLFLENNIENDVGGNHLFENGTALVMGGATFPTEGKRFLHAGLTVLESAIESQLLGDGYHYERSPMYHLAVTMKLITALSVVREAGSGVPDWLHEATLQACAFARYLRPPDGRIPLLNDSVFGETERMDTVLRYAQSIDIGSELVSAPKESQLHWLQSDNISVLFDAGDSGPPRQLGHVHNDPCTIIVWSGGHRLVTDTGTFDYQPGEKRDTAKSIQGHNTVQVAGTEPVASGGRFRMGDAIQTTTTQISNDTVTVVSAAYRAGVGEAYSHRRTCYEGPDWLLIWDSVDTDACTITTRLHAHPDVSIEDGSRVRFIHNGRGELTVRPFGTAAGNIGKSPYYPRFGVEYDREVLTLTGRTSSFGYLLTTKDIEAKLTQSDRTPVELQIGEENYRLPEVIG